MPVPRRRRSKAKKGSNRAHKHLHPSQDQVCPNCKESKLPHRVCTSCGQYNGRQYRATVTKA